MLIQIFVQKVINKNFKSSWNYWLHGRANWFGDHTFRQILKIVVKNIFKIFKKVHLLLYYRYMDHKKGILLKKIRIIHSR